MRIGLTVIFGLVIGACALWGSGLASQPAEAAAPAAPSAGGVVGIGTPGSCTPSALHTRLAGGGLVTFNCGAAPVTIVVSPTEVISLNTTIQGGGVITLSGGLAGPILDIEGGLVTLADLTLADGYNEGGGAVYNNGQLTVSHSRFVNNVAIAVGGAILSGAALTITHSDFYSNSAGNGGGAIYATVSLTIHDSAFENNHAGEGGAILYNTNAGRNGPAAGLQFILDGSRFFSNTATIDRGGAILNFGTATIANSDFDGSQAPDGGALHNALDATLTVQDSRFLSNSANSGAGGAIFNLGHLVVNESTFTANNAGSFGGALVQDVTGEALVTNSTFTGNVAFLGGGLVTSGTLTVRNTTLTGNAATGGGGLLVMASALTITVTNSTLAGNSAASASAIGSLSSAPVLLKNTILAGLAGGNCMGAITSLGHNLSDDHTCGLTATGDLTDTAPLLGPLADNGGPTQTMALLIGSPAINHGDNNGCPATDQRGFLRVAGCDSGAFEYAFRTLLPLVRR